MGRLPEALYDRLEALVDLQRVDFAGTAHQLFKVRRLLSLESPLPHKDVQRAIDTPYGVNQCSDDAL